MPRGKERDLALDQEILGIEPREIIEGPVHEGHVGASVAEQPGLLTHLAKKDLDRCRTGFARDRFEEPLQERMRGPGLRHEHERPLRIPGTSRPTPSGRDRVEGHSGLAEHHLAGVGERHATTVTVEEQDTEPLLQLADRAREWWLCDPEPNGRASEVQFLGDGDEVAEFTGLKIAHGRSLPPDTR